MVAAASGGTQANSRERAVKELLGRPVLLILGAVGLLGAGVQQLAPSAGLLKILPPEERRAMPNVPHGRDAFPRTTRDTDDFEVRVARPARSVVSQYWSIDEFVYSVVPPVYVKGVSETAFLERISNVYPQVKRYGPVIATDPERVLRLNPDLILVSGSARADFTALVRSTGVPTYRMFTMFTTLEQVADSIRLVGSLTGEDEAADAEYARFQQAVARARARRPAGAAAPRVLGFGGRYGYGRRTLFHDIVRTLGAVNVGAEGGLDGYESVNSEQILRWNPEWIVTGADAGKTKQQLQKLLSDPAIGLTQAARNGRILILDQRLFLPMSPYTAVALEALGEALYGR